MFQILPLNRDEFSKIFDYDDDELNKHGIHKIIANAKPAFPCRVSLDFADIGEEVYLLNYEHQKAITPYNSKYAIYIRKNAKQIELKPNELAPIFLRDTPISVRAFDENGFLICAEIANGPKTGEIFTRILQNERIDYLHAHFAAYGCYAAKIIRA